MLHVVLVILKILGILLLVILGILLLLVFAVLFVPIRYRADASYNEKPVGSVSVSWLLHAVTVRIAYDGELNFRVKVLWFTLLGGKKDEPDELDDFEEDELMVQATELAPEEPAVHADSEARVNERGPEAPTAPKEPAVHADSEARSNEAPSTKAEQAFGQAQSVQPAREPEPQGPSGTEGESPKLSRLKEKLCGPLQRIIKKIRATLKNLQKQWRKGQKSYQKAHDFLADEENKKTIALLFHQTKKLFRHIFPKKLKGHLRFGFDDPYYTGQVLTAVSPFYGLYAKSFTLIPVFEEKALEGEVTIKGRVRAASLLWIGLRVLLNKNFRRLLKAWRKRGM